MHRLLMCIKLTGDKVLPALAIFISTLAANAFVEVPRLGSVLYSISNLILKEVPLFPYKVKQNWSKDAQKSEDRKDVIVPV